MKRFFKILKAKKRLKKAKTRFDACCELFVEGTFSTDNRIDLQLYWDDKLRVDEAQEDLNLLLN